MVKHSAYGRKKSDKIRKAEGIGETTDLLLEQIGQWLIQNDPLVDKQRGSVAGCKHRKPAHWLVFSSCYERNNQPQSESTVQIPK